ncbi:MAG: OmpA family protein [Clostridiales bacterium]|nr:OmpA family protein [Clostridiales bacterium]
MKLRRHRERHREEEENFWPAFTDMISTVVLILFFLVLVFYMEKIITMKTLSALKDQLAETEIVLNQKSESLTETEENLSISRLEIESNILELKVLQSELEAGKDDLKLAQEAIDDQKSIIEQSNDELASLRSKLEGIALLRVDVLEKVKDSIEEELGETNASGEALVSIGDNGNIIINESLVFDTDSSSVKESGKQLLDNLAIAFENVLSDPSIRENIDAISIQGHTDERASQEYNRELSARRAYSVVNYLMKSNPDLADDFGSYFAASAYSEFRPLDLGTSDAAYAKNRRIEISVILKDSHVQNVINTYLQESLDDFDAND